MSTKALARSGMPSRKSGPGGPVPKGFTLIELLIVVAIIGVLAAIAVPNFMNARIRALVARVQGDIAAIGMALDMYNLDHNKYPPFMLNGFNDLGKYGLKKLTSPIAYISNAILWDPFMSQGKETNHGANYPPPYNYIYHDRETCGGTGSAWWENYDPEMRYMWYLCSVGPDQLFYHPNNSGPRWNWLISYQASNGVISMGNIYLYGPGRATEKDIKAPSGT